MMMTGRFNHISYIVYAPNFIQWQQALL